MDSARANRTSEDARATNVERDTRDFHIAGVSII